MSGLFLAAGVWMAVLGVAVLWRMWRGPTTADRVVALDAINTLTVGGMVAGAIWLKGTWLVDVAIVYALLSYVGTLYIARTLEREE